MYLKGLRIDFFKKIRKVGYEMYKVIWERELKIINEV